MIPAAAFLCLVVAVGDGDSLRCRGLDPAIRLDGVDAFERRQPHGPLARRALVELVSGREIACEPTGTSYDRIVARCLTPRGRDVSCVLAAAGVAIVDPRFDDRCARAEAEAAFWGVGAHGGRFIMPWRWRKGQR